VRIAAAIAFLKQGPEDRAVKRRLAAAGSAFEQEVPMEGEGEKFNRPAGAADEVEAHKFEPEDSDREKFETLADDEDVEAHKF
jgi:hypothetical protein